MNIYSGLGRITLPHVDSVKQVYISPRYRQEPVKRIEPYTRHNHPVEQYTGIERINADHPDHGASQRNSVSTVPVKFVSAEGVGSLFDRYA